MVRQEEIRRFICVLYAALLPGSVADLAAQVEAPSWRGSDGSTYQEWQFLTNDNPAAAEFYSNTFGLASASVSNGAFASGWLWDELFLGAATGYWDLGQSGGMELTVPGYTGPTTNGIKEVRVQVVQWIDGAIYSLYAGVSIPDATLVSRTNRVFEQTGFGAWRVDDWLFQVADETGPDLVNILGASTGTIIDIIVVDVLAVPEPMPVLVLVLSAGIMLLQARRLRHR